MDHAGTDDVQAKGLALIFPILRGLVRPHLAPLTCFLFALNVFVFIATYDDYQKADKRLDVILDDERFLGTQGVAFAVMIRDNEAAGFSPTLRDLANQVFAGDADSRRVLGSLALRNREFMGRAVNYEFAGDEIALKQWRERFEEVNELQNSHPSYLWGISQSREGWVNWISYQFAHSGFGHLFWNMLFLLIFGTCVELGLGSSFVVLTYLGGGIAGAFVFSRLSGISSSPLVGASAAVSGLMGLVVFAFWKERLRFFYWLLPMKGYYGFTQLPSWIVLVVFVLPDISGYLSAVPDFGSVAYSAHLGGTGFGLAMAALLKLGILVREQEQEGEKEEPQFNDVL